MPRRKAEAAAPAEVSAEEALTLVPFVCPTTLELFSDPSSFGITNPSPAQQAIAQALDGLDVGDLWDDPQVRAVFGGVRPEPGVTPDEVLLVAASRAGKSKLVAARMVRCALTCDMGQVALGDEVRVTILGPDLDKTRPAFTNMLALMKRRFPDMLESELKTSFRIVRNKTLPSIEVTMSALSGAGGGVVARWCAAAMFTEAPRIIGEDEGDKNLESSLDALQNRMLPGGQVVCEGSPWAPWGPIFKKDMAHFGKPTAALLVLRANGPTLWPERYTPTYCLKLLLKNPRAHQADVEGRYVDPENALIPTAMIDACIDADVLMREPIRDKQTGALVHEYVFAMDPATRGNAWTLVGLRCIAKDRYEEVLLLQWQGTPDKPLKASIVLREARDALAPYGSNEVYTDQASFDTLDDTATNLGKLDIADGRPDGGPLSLVGLFGELDSKDEDCAHVCLAIGEERIRLLDDVQQKMDLQRVKKRVTTNDAVFQYVQSGDGRHCDTVPALGKCLRFAPEPPGAVTVDPEERSAEPPRTSAQRQVLRLHGRTS